MSVIDRELHSFNRIQIKKMFKNLTLTIVFAASLAVMAFGQLKTPAPSPSATIMQTVGLTDVEINYSRPSAKGRTIFAANGLVPYGKLYRTGANYIPKITFSNDVTIEGEELKAGSYGVLTTPGASSWGVHFYTYDTGNWGSYKEKEAALTVNVGSKKNANHVESFTISVDAMSMDNATINIAWANTIVPIKLGVDAKSKVLASIEKMVAGPTAGSYYQAGAFLYDAKTDLGKALMYVQKATKVDNPKFWQVRRESLILAELGRKAEAITAAKLSLELAKTAGNNDYVKMNTDSIKEWSM